MSIVTYSDVVDSNDVFIAKLLMTEWWRGDDFPHFLTWMVENNTYKVNQIIQIVESPYKYARDYTDFQIEKLCEHKEGDYQPKADDTGVPESYSCKNCHKELDIPDPHDSEL